VGPPQSPGRETAGGCADQAPARRRAVLQVGRVDHRRQDQAKGIDQEMALLAFDLLTRIIARRVDRDPPFFLAFHTLAVNGPSGGRGFRKTPGASGLIGTKESLGIGRN